MHSRFLMYVQPTFSVTVPPPSGLRPVPRCPAGLLQRGNGEAAERHRGAQAGRAAPRPEAHEPHLLRSEYYRSVAWSNAFMLYPAIPK